MDRLFAKQVAKATRSDGSVDMAVLGELVIGAYEESERDRRRTERSIQLMVDELDALNSRDRERLLTQLKVQNQRFESALENMSQGLCMFDGEHRLIVCNRPYAEMYGLSAELTAAGTPLAAITKARIAAGTLPAGAPEDYAAEINRLARLNQPWQKIWELRDGRVIAVTSRPMPDGGWVATHQDITERRQAEAKIVHMARHDALTDLPNRTYFHDHLDRFAHAASRQAPVAVLSLDLDQFKPINDTFGHPFGDRLLLVVAERLLNCIRGSDLVARFGGDEFMIIQSGVDQPLGATALAERLIERLSAPYEIEGNQVVIGVSIGIAIAPIDGTSTDVLIKNADMALYQAKSEGRGIYRFFEAEMDAQMKQRRTLETDLREALVEDEFELYFQPVVDLATDRVSSFEALLRWHHPRRGLLAPTEFIPLAEEIGLIIPIGEWVLRQACTEAATWPEDIAVAVNLSPVQFRSKTNLVELTAATLAASGLAPDRLMLEITETALMQDDQLTLSILHELRGLGIRISMDDFGTGYSSLSYLRRFPFDKIKIDRSFIKDFPERLDSLSIVRAVAGLGANLGIPTTAEGVETKAQVEMLRANGCSEGQGHYFSRPRPASDIPAILADLRAVA